MKVLVIPEDFRKDQYMLKPIGNYKRLRQLCREDLLNLEQRIKDWLDILK